MAMKTSVLVVVVLVVMLTEHYLCQSALNVSHLHDQLLTLNTNVRPVKNLSHPSPINVTFFLMSIITYDTAQQKLVSNGFMAVEWQNEFTSWTPAHYGGVRSINPQSERMWRPRLTIMNSLKDPKPIGDDYVVLSLQNDGLVSWYPSERFETFCRVEVTYFPFDTQHCRWDLMTWADNATSILLMSPSPEIQLHHYSPNGAWQVMSTRARTKYSLTGVGQISFLTFEVTLRRRPTLLVLTVLLPVFVLSVVNVYTFTIPSEAGERLAYSMTSLLSFGVFMGFILDYMPSSTETLSIVAVNMSGQLVLSAVYVLLCILSLRLFHRDPHKHPVPPSLQTLVVWLELLTCLEPPSKTHPDPQVDVTSSNISGHAPGVEMNVGQSRDNRYHHLKQLHVDGIATVVSDSEYITQARNGWLKGQLGRLARRRKMKQEAYTRPQDMTWQRVSRTLDKLLFRFFFCLVIVANGVIFIVLIHHYNTAN